MSSTSRPVIVAAAKELISSGHPDASLAQVASRAGVSRQAVYLHFGSRAGLLTAVVRSMDEDAQIREKLERAIEVEDPVEAFRQFVRQWVRFAIEILPVASSLFAARREDPAAAEAWEDRSRDLRAGFRTLAGRIGDEGLLRDGLTTQTAANLTWAYCSIPVVEQLLVDLGWSADRVGREMTRAAWHAICGPADSSVIGSGP